MAKYLTIKESAEFSGKAEITIRRLVREIVKGDDQRLRKMIKPDQAEVTQKVQEKQPFAYTISEELLITKFKSEEQGNEAQAEGEKRKGVVNNDGLIVALKDQVDDLKKEKEAKNKQIESQQQTIDMLSNHLNERLRESNVLMKGLQDRLALPAPRQTRDTTVVEGSAQEQGSKTDATEPKPKKTKKKDEKKDEPPTAEPKSLWRKLLGQ